MLDYLYVRTEKVGACLGMNNNGTVGTKEFGGWWPPCGRRLPSFCVWVSDACLDRMLLHVAWCVILHALRVLLAYVIRNAESVTDPVFTAEKVHPRILDFQ